MCSLSSLTALSAGIIVQCQFVNKNGAYLDTRMCSLISHVSQLMLTGAYS